MTKLDYVQQSGEATIKVVESRHVSRSGVTRVIEKRYIYIPGMPLQTTTRRYTLFPSSPK